ncbi:MAG: hypothetical protein GC159_24310 [Phycisphaera sp.]|nr:hypothetical protein [Phycisphaera sp.]
MQVRLTRKAHADLDSIWNYIAIEQGREQSAAHVLRGIKDQLKKLGDFPRMGRHCSPVFGEGVRRFTALRSFVVYYRVLHDADLVEVLHIFHGAQDAESSSSDLDERSDE